MAASLVALCLGLGLGAARGQETAAAPPPSDDPPITLPAPPSDAFFTAAQKPPQDVKEEKQDKDKQDKDKQEDKQDKDKAQEKDKDAPSLVYPRKERLGPGSINPLVPGRKGDEDVDFVVRTELPGSQRLYRRESEAKMFERIRQESDRPGAAKVYFPEETTVSRETYQGRNFPPQTSLVEPAYVYHGRLLFEQLNLDRYGWDLGVLQPVASVGAYYYDLAMLPYHICSRPFDKYEVSAGKCLPGDPAPFLLYPEPFSVTGLAGMAGSYTTGMFLFR